MIGAAARIQGYAAREGFGITLLRNHTVDVIPKSKNHNFPGI